MNFYGGPVVWVLVLMLITAVVTFFERLIDIRRSHIDYQDFIKGVINTVETGNDAEALHICDESRSPVANIVATAIQHRDGSARVLRDAVDSRGRVEIGRLDRRMAVLAIIGQVAPLVGMFGTVIGLIRTMLALSSQTPVLRVELLNITVGSMIPAAFGLGLAIAVIVMYGSLRVRFERVVVDLEAAASEIVGYLSTSKEKEIHR